MPSYAQEQWMAMLKRLADRDASVELSRRSADNEGPDISYRTRLLGLDVDGNIIVERPMQAIFDKSFGKSDDIELLLMHNNERLIATCTIKDIFIHEVNTHVKPCCYLLSPGRRPQRDQRRSFFRVGIAALDLPPALLVYEAEDEEQSYEFKARLVNLSAGGLGVSVRLSRQLLNRIKRTRHFKCYAQFGRGNSIDAEVRVAHLSALGDDGLYLGLQFEQVYDLANTALEDQMHQLCLNFQREAIKRQRA